LINKKELLKESKYSFYFITYFFIGQGSSDSK